MNVRNIGGKIVSIGATTILPGETKPVSDSYAYNAAVACLVEHGNIELIRSKSVEPKPPAQEEPPAQEPPAQEPLAEEPPAEEPPAQDGDGEPEKKPLSRMNKAELVEECRKLGIEVSPDDTNPALVEKIKAATAE